MRPLSSIFLPVLLGLVHITLAQTLTFSNFAHDCAETGYNGDFTSVTGSNCAFNVTNKPFPPMSFLSLDNCLSFDGNKLVGNQGGGYTSNCSSCTGTTAFQFGCTCEGVAASIILNDYIGVNWTDGNICCSSGTHVSCGVFGAQVDSLGHSGKRDLRRPDEEYPGGVLRSEM